MAKGRISFYAACGWLLLVVVSALTAGFWPFAHTPDQMDTAALSALPGAAHLLGTDGIGRDILARLVFGARVSLVVGLFAPLSGLVLGLLLGMPAAFCRGWFERIVTFACDVMLAFPALIFLLVFTQVLGPSLITITLGLGLLLTPRFIRVVRANTTRFRDQEFVLAARMDGAGAGALMVKEILPNIAASLLSYTLVVTGFVIIAEGGLGFLGLSVPSPTPSWGGMIAAGRDVLEEAPHVALIPLVVMFLTVLAVNIVGDRVRGRYDRS